MKKQSKRSEIIKRLQNLNSRTLREYSKITRQINYQYGSTKTALINAVRQLPKGTATERRNLTAIENLLEQYERVSEFGEKGIIDNYYDLGSENIRQFIRIQRDVNKWTYAEILVALENDYTAIEHMSSGDMLNMANPTDEEMVNYYG